jgi:hypothetical protein
MPVLKGSGKYDNYRQVREGNRLVYKGHNRMTDQWEVITELGSEPVGLQTTTAGGIVYVTNPQRGQPGQPDFIPAAGISQPSEGLEQWVDAGGGKVKKQKTATFRGGRSSRGGRLIHHCAYQVDRPTAARCSVPVW